MELFHNILKSILKIFSKKFKSFKKSKKLIIKEVRLIENNKNCKVNIDSNKIVKYNRSNKEKFTLENKNRKINNADDKIYRKMFDVKFEAVQFINEKLNLKLNEEELEKYNRSFVTHELCNRTADIIYKIKGRNVFFLLEHQTKKDATMPWRLVEYKVELLQGAIDIKKKGKKNFKIPLVIPIVLYTGREVWNIADEIERIQEKLEGYEEPFGKYTLIDINQDSDEKLLYEKTYLSKISLLEKYKRNGNLAEWIKKIINEINEHKNEYKGEGKEVLYLMISKVLKSYVGKEKTENLLTSFEKEGDDMLQILETIEEEKKMFIDKGRKEGRKKGRQEGKKVEKNNIIKEMLKKNMAIDLIAEVTHSSRNSILKIAKS